MVQRGLDEGLAEEEYPFQTTMISCTLEIQDIFLDIPVPGPSAFDSLPFVETDYMLVFTRLDQILTFSAQPVPAIVACILYPQCPEKPPLTVKILSSPTTSTIIHNLNAIINEAWTQSGFWQDTRRLDIEAYGDVI